MHKRLTIDPRNPGDVHLRQACTVLHDGGLIVYPTDTLYGIGADPGNEFALQRVQQVKRRLEPKPLLLIAASLVSAQTVVETFPPAAVRLAEEFWPGPLTMILRARATVSQVVTQGTGTVGLRIPSNTFCLELTERFGGPITSTSANVTGEPTSASIEAIESTFGDEVDLYLDGGPLPSTLPSTIIDLSKEFPQLLRRGVVSPERLQRILPELQV